MTQLEPNTLYVRVHEGLLTTLFCVLEETQVTSGSFLGKPLVRRCGNSQMADSTCGMLNQSTIFVLAGTAFRRATKSDLVEILRNWNHEPGYTCRERWLMDLEGSPLSKSELVRLSSLLVDEIRNIHK